MLHMYTGHAGGKEGQNKYVGMVYVKKKTHDEPPIA